MEQIKAQIQAIRDQLLAENPEPSQALVNAVQRLSQTIAWLDVAPESTDE